MDSYEITWGGGEREVGEGNLGRAGMILNEKLGRAGMILNEKLGRGTWEGNLGREGRIISNGKLGELGR